MVAEESHVWNMKGEKVPAIDISITDYAEACSFYQYLKNFAKTQVSLEHFDSAHEAVLSLKNVEAFIKSIKEKEDTSDIEVVPYEELMLTD